MSVLAVKKPGEENFHYGENSIAHFFIVEKPSLVGRWWIWEEVLFNKKTFPPTSFYDQKSDSEDAFYLIPKEFLLND